MVYLQKDTLKLVDSRCSTTYVLDHLKIFEKIAFDYRKNLEFWRYNLSDKKWHFFIREKSSKAKNGDGGGNQLMYHFHVGRQAR